MSGVDDSRRMPAELGVRARILGDRGQDSADGCAVGRRAAASVGRARDCDESSRRPAERSRQQRRLRRVQQSLTPDEPSGQRTFLGQPRPGRFVRPPERPPVPPTTDKFPRTADRPGRVMHRRRAVVIDCAAAVLDRRFHRGRLSVRRGPAPASRRPMVMTTSRTNAKAKSAN
jgi:hypothetical protein